MTMTISTDSFSSCVDKVGSNFGTPIIAQLWNSVLIWCQGCIQVSKQYFHVFKNILR